MSFEFKFPDVGEGIHEGELVKWLVKEGDKIKADQPIAEIETDKAVVEIPSPKNGVVLRLNWKPGDTIKVGEILLVLGEEGEKASEVQIEKQEMKSLEKIQEKLETPSNILKPTIFATPATKKIAKELNIDLSKVVGTGSNGRITDQDVRNYANKIQNIKPEISKEEIKAPKITFEKYGEILKIPLKGMRKTIAENMVRSKFTATHVTHMDEVDITDLVKVREKEKKLAENYGIHLTFLPFIIKALLAALKEHPYLNSSLDEEKQEIVIKKYYNIGIAVQTSDGLMVPVVKRVDDKSIMELAKEIQDLAEKAKARRIDIEDMKGGTFTITNYGSIGGIYGTPIINYPEVAILGVGRIIEKPVVKNKKIVIRKILPLSLTFDHRVVDGAEVAEFMNSVIRRLEDPDTLLMYVD